MHSQSLSLVKLHFGSTSISFHCYHNDKVTYPIKRIISKKKTDCLAVVLIFHPAGDVLWTLVEPGKVVPQISVGEHWSWLSGNENR